LNYETWQTFNETWAYDYDTNAWTKMNPKTQPPGLYAHAMAYDSESDRVIMWGGNIWTGVDSEGNWLSENPENLVWAYDYNTDTWESFPVTNGPNVIRITQLAQTVVAVYVPSVDRVYFYWEDQFWAYDFNTNTWEKAKGDVMSGAGNRVAQCMVYLPTTQRVLVFGGANTGKEWWDLSFNNDTWLYDPKTGDWTKAGP
jgi:N-acetylneuraminic acid mutarotase